MSRVCAFGGKGSDGNMVTLRIYSLIYRSTSTAPIPGRICMEENMRFLCLDAALNWGRAQETDFQELSEVRKGLAIVWRKQAKKETAK